MKDELKGLAYTLSQGLRVSQYLGQMTLGNIALGRVPSKEDRKRQATPAVVLKDLKNLLERDFQNIQAGIYKMPRDLVPGPLAFSKSTVRVVKDVFRVRRRQAQRSVQEVPDEAKTQGFPTYYTQNFHFQTDGYLSSESADLYDHQVELVFGGGADAMRRQALLPLYHFLADKAESERAQLNFLDVACGTGRFLQSVKENYPWLHVTGLDLSPWYLKKARAGLSAQTRVDFVEANAEQMPFRDEQFDVVSSIYLFHELPRLVRARVVKEIVRVLRPGGIFIFEDSLQLGDKPIFDGSLKLFPTNYHEPYFADYIQHDLMELFKEERLVPVESDTAFFSKILTLRKPS